jgi:hypothetical protein
MESCSDQKSVEQISFVHTCEVCKAVKAKGGYFEEYQIYFAVTPLVTTWFPICYFMVLISPLLYKVENSTNKDTLEWVGVNFGLVLYISLSGPAKHPINKTNRTV